MPVIGYLIIFDERIAGFLSANSTVIPSLIGDETIIYDVVNLYYYYFGFLSIGIASLIYQAFCPTIIKQHGTELDFISRHGTNTSVAELLHMAQEAIRLSPMRKGRVMPASLAIQEGKVKTVELSRTILFEYYEAVDNRYQLVLWSSSVIYAAGATSIGIPSIRGVLRVIATFSTS
jgi:hypothetical protein